MSSGFPKSMGLAWPAGARVAVIAARFNGDIVEALLKDCVARLKELGATDITVERVPGAFELPLAGKWAAEKHDAVVCLGCVIRGDTPHFEYVCESAAAGISRAALDTGKPVIFGVLTTNSHEQAVARTNGSHSRGGYNFAEAAAEMLGVKLRVLSGG
jgi:6,7-dimethyl-8-ribityllumazine synthase